MNTPHAIIIFTMLIPKFFMISLLSSIITASFFTKSYSKCLDNQKSLLLELKNELIFNSSLSVKLVQWNQTSGECCSWYGVECDAAGNVISLQLDDEAISGGIGDSSSLFRLEHLEKLNLAYNDFINDTPILRGIQHLSYLTHLNLSCVGGQIPLEISSLRRLVSLDISTYYVDDLEMILQNLTGLRELYLDSAYFDAHESREWSHVISSCLPHLTSLSLSYCGLSGPINSSFWQLHSLSFLRLDGSNLSTVVPDLFLNFSNLTTLSLAGCELRGHFPNKVFNLPTLQNLDLSDNNLLSGSIPPLAFTLSKSLKSIVLRGTNFSGSIPSSVSHLKTLSHLDLSSCYFTGTIISTFANLTQLVHVDLSDNFFTGTFSSTLFSGLSNLVYLNLGYNSFTGNIPHSLFGPPSLLDLHLSKNQVEESPIVNVSKIRFIDLSGNRLQGPIPDSFYQLQSLESLLLSSNLFNGTFQLEKIQCFANLTELELSANNLSVSVGNNNSSSYTFPMLHVLRLSSCNLNVFPSFFKQSKDITHLDPSDNRIVGAIPRWIWGRQLFYLNLSHNLLTDLQKPYHIPASLRMLYLQSNQLRGELHLPLLPTVEDQTSQLWYLSVAKNNLSGSIPTSLCNATQLSSLDLSENRLSGTIPPCILENNYLLEVFNLGGNNISGRIPDNISLDCGLQYLDLNNNTLQGKLPKSLGRCKWLGFMNVGNNFINDTFPCMLSSSLIVLVLRSNRFHGEVTSCHKSWPVLQIVDVSSNNFSGSLESINFSSWRAMQVLQVSRNHSRSQILESYNYTVRVKVAMKGLEVDLFKIWSDFIAIDFSCNNFKGELPDEIGDLSSLLLLNLSHNAFNGSIPKLYRKLGELESLDLSENILTGTIPEELAQLTFLGFLNLSYNNLVGMIPKGSQFQTFSADSYQGNPGLWGFPLITDVRGLSPAAEHENDESSEREIEWEYVSAALGYVVGLGIIVWLLLFCRSFRDRYFGKIEEVVEDVVRNRVLEYIFIIIYYPAYNEINNQ